MSVRGACQRSVSTALVGITVVGVVLAGCANLSRHPDPGFGADPWDDPDLTFSVGQVADDRTGGFVVVGGTTWQRHHRVGDPSPRTGPLPWDVASIAPLPDGRLVVATVPGGMTQTPQIAVVDLDSGAEEVLVGRPEQRPLPLAPGAPVSPDGTPAAEAYLGTVLDVEVTHDGSVLWLEQLWVEYADQDIFVVRRLDADGTLQTVAGRAGDPAAPPLAPRHGDVATEVVLDAPDPRITSSPDGSFVIASQSWTVRVAASGLLTDAAPGLLPCSTAPTLAETRSDGMALLRVGLDSAPARSVEGWEVAPSSDHAAQVVSAARESASCSVVVLPGWGAPVRPSDVESVPALDGATDVTFFADDQLVAVFRGSGDLSAMVGLSLP